MSNRTEFFVPAHEGLSLPAATISVQVGGRLCSALEPLEIVLAGWPGFSRARLAYNPAARTGAAENAEAEIESEFPVGSPLCIGCFYNTRPPGASTEAVPIFCGRIEGIESTFGPKAERIEVIARDFSATLERATVYGRRVAGENGSSVFLQGLDTVFGPDGKPNASAVPVQVNGRSYTAFCAEPSRGRAWTYAEAIEYLLAEHLQANCLQLVPVERLRALTENQVVRDLDVTGLSLLEALHRCCQRIHVRFRFVPRLCATGPREAIEFYKDGSGRRIELNCQRSGQKLGISRTNVAAVASSRSFWPVTNRHIAQGDFKLFEATFDLVKAWDPQLEDTDYDKFSPSTNPDFYQVKDVYRKWCLNEAGDYSCAPFDQGDAFDFTRIFGTSDYCRRRRRFWPALTADKQGRSLGYYVQVSYDSGANWWQYLYAFNNLLDECGIWLSSDQLDVETWIAALKGALRFRITASVISDERLTCTIADGPVNSSAAVTDRLITLPRQFKYRKVSTQSIFAGSTDQSPGTADEVDDTDALYEFVRHRSQGAAELIETAEVRTPYVAFDYRPGDIVEVGPDSRLLPGASDNRSTKWIERVEIDFAAQCTNLKIVRKRL